MGPCPAYDGGEPWVGARGGATVGFIGFGHIGAHPWELAARVNRGRRPPPFTRGPRSAGTSAG